MAYASVEERRISRRISYVKRKDKILTKEREYWAKNVEVHRDRRFKSRYGISLKEFEALLISQNNRCALCEEALKIGTKSVHVDHCHQTNKVRGILCARCNLGIGRFGDNIEGLQKAIAYLQKSLNQWV